MTYNGAYSGSFRDNIDQFDETVTWFEQTREQRKLANSVSNRLAKVVEDLATLGVVLDLVTTFSDLDKYKASMTDADKDVYERMQTGLRLADDLGLSEEEYARVQQLVWRYDALNQKPTRKTQEVVA